MAWTTPVIKSVGNLIDETTYNDQIINNLTYLKTRPGGYVIVDANDITTTSTTFQDVGSPTPFTITYDSTGADLLVGFMGSVTHSSSPSTINFNIMIDTTDKFADDGCFVTRGSTNIVSASFVVRVTGITAGSRTVKLRWKVQTATATLYAGNTSSGGLGVHPSFWAFEVN